MTYEEAIKLLDDETEINLAGKWVPYEVTKEVLQQAFADHYKEIKSIQSPRRASRSLYDNNGLLMEMPISSFK